ncbi:MAG: discoidin domain-containing protein [Pirellulaceae bacterium]
MMTCLQRVGVVLLLILLGGMLLGQSGPVKGKPVSEAAIVKLIELEIEDAEIIANIGKNGVGFEANDETVQRLKDAGASADVVAAVQKSAAKPKPGAKKAPKAVTLPDVVELLENGASEETLLALLKKSPTVFTLGADDETALKKAGASAELLAAMKGTRELSPQTAELITDFAIVLDCSGSMKELTKEGETKMVAAKRVVTDLVQKIPEGMNVTFVIYGHEVFGAADDPRNCQAVKIARPLTALDVAGKAELSSLIAGLKPTGTTPIALSLRIAGEELIKNDAFCGLVLITDGLETCKGDPVAEAARLAGNPKLTFGVHVVGFGAKPEEDKALAEIAKAGKGKYYGADSAAELTDSFDTIAKELKTAALPPEADEVLINLAAKANGGVLIDCPTQYSVEYAAANLIDSPGAEVFVANGGDPVSVVIGFQDGRLGRISAVAVNPATAERQTRWVSEVEVEVSATYPFTGFKKIGTFAVPALADDALLKLKESVVARYVRFTFLKNGGDMAYMQAAEVLVLGTLVNDAEESPPPALKNVALAANGGKIVKVSSEYKKGSAANLIDGSPGKSWSSTSGSAQMVVIQLADESLVSHVAINPHYGDDKGAARWVKEAEILLSMSDPVGYKSVGKIKLEQVGRDQVLTLRTPVRAKFLKAVLPSNGADYLEANEIKVFAKQAE